MSPAFVAFSRRLTPLAQLARQQSLGFVLLAASHVAASAILLWTEERLVPQLVFVLGWIFFNSSWLVVLRRPVFAGAITLSFLVLLLALSRFKHQILLMTVNFLDLLLIDAETIAFLLQVFPNLDVTALAGTVVLVLGLALLWRCDPFRIARPTALKYAAGSLAALVALALAVPSDPWEEFYAENYFSKYLRSGVTVLNDLATRGILDSDKAVSERLAAPPVGPCSIARPPHIIMIHDESSFDARAIPGIRVPAGYGKHFLSDDGRQRTLLVEGAGGPSWFTEYNILTGLSARSFGRFADFVTRIAAGRVERGLPHNLRSCGYRTFTLYPMYGSFMSARAFQGSAGIDHFLDSRALGARFQDTDAFYFNAAADRLAQERTKGPVFALVYTAQNHFPWNFRFRPDLAPEWRDPGNRADVDEYLRRQHLTAVDYQAFKARLQREFPDEPILLVRFGDHQPYFARSMIDPSQDDGMVARRIAAADPRFLATYYSIESINFSPRDTSLARDALDAPYLPLVVLEAAGVPLDSSFAEQKRILERCGGLFYRCNGGAEARRFNRLLIDAGKIKGL